jgi:aminoglycoside N3'-acetyltransferase
VPRPGRGLGGPSDRPIEPPLPGLNQARLSEDLARLGVRPGDLLMVHASLRKLGLAASQYGRGGAELLLDALDAAVGPTGTLMMTLGTHYDMDWANSRPVAEREALFADAPVFDPDLAAAQPDAGWLAESFRRRAGTMFSANPSGRFGARGARAAALMADQPWDDYYGPGSPLEKFVAQGGRILRLGADPDTVTALHYAEYLADLPAKHRTRWDYVLAGPDGARRQVWIECLDDSGGIGDWPHGDYFAAILGAYLPLGRHQAGRVGEATAELLDAADLVAFGARWMEENLTPPAQP